jgi:hypothetical protein
MRQGKRTPEEICQKIRELLFEDEKRPGKELKNQVEKDPAFAKLNISVRTYQTIRKRELPKIIMVKASIPENKWSLGAMASTNEITPEAIPYIIEIQRWAPLQMMSISHLPYPPVTVRQAKWVSRILPLFFAIFRPTNETSDIELGWLYKWSRVYAIHERLYELTGKKEVFETSELDAGLLRGDRIDIFGDTYVRFSGKANPGNTSKSIFVVTSDKEILNRSLEEGPIEESVYKLSELPKFKNMVEGLSEKKVIINEETK